MEIKIGILLPRSDMFPTLASDFLNGVKLALKSSFMEDIIPKFIIESIGNATGETVLRAAEKMILQEDTNVILSFCSIFKLKELAGIFNAYKKPLIHLDLGGNVLKEEHSGPYIVHHTLNIWQSAYYAGVYAANSFGKNAALVASFYDGGYHIAESFVRGFTENGGNIVYTYVSPMDYKTESFEIMDQGLQNANPDFIYLLFSYKEGDKVLEVISKSPLNGRIPLLVNPFMTVENNNSKNSNIENVFSIATWAFNAEIPGMNNFQSNYLSVYNDSPNSICLLGYEVGLTISSCIERNKNIPAKIGDFVKSIVLESPRGELTFSGFNESLISKNRILKFSFNDKQYKNTVVNTIDSFNQKALYEKFSNLPLTGWQNPYIIT